MSTCAVHLLGPLQVIWEAGQPPRFRSQRTMALLSYLAAEQRPVARDALAALFWPDEPSSKGRANLRRELHNLGNLLPGCWQTDRQTVEFVPAVQTCVDVYQLLHFEAGGRWIDAAELVRGDFLEGVHLEDNLEFETWLLGERERWRQRAERVLSKAVEAQERSGDGAGALRFARQLLQLMPWREETHRTVMRLLALSGQRSAALRQFEMCRQVLRDELRVEVSAETQALYERIRESSTFALHNIPAPTTALIGREKELDLLEGWLADPDLRLVTITGAGGMGKTRLALGLAQNYLERPARPFGDGIYFVSLAALSEPAQLVSAIAETLKFPLRSRDGRSPRQQLLDYLRGKQMLLILDNFEHLLAGRELVMDILQAAARVRILTTSREHLRVAGERLLPLQGLAYDDDRALQGEETEGRAPAAAAQLFLVTAKRVALDFGLDHEDQHWLSRVCRLVEGMPLALELAATWADTLSLAGIAREMEHSLDFLETPRSGIPERHRSIRAVIDTSWKRLSPRERQALLALSIFRGGFTLEAARVVTGASIKVLSRLVNCSLLRYQPERGRYEIHELLRQYAAGLLTPAQRMEIRGRHLEYFVRFAERVKAWQEGAGQESNMEWLEKEAGNFWAALSWSLQDPARATQGLRLAAELEWFWKLGAHYEEGATWLARLLAVGATDVNPTVTAQALKVAGDLELPSSGDRERAIALYRESMAIQEASGEDWLRVPLLASLGHLEIQCGNVNEARTHLEEGLLLAQELEDGWAPSTLVLFVGLAPVALAADDVAAARAHCERGLALAKEIGAQFQVRLFLNTLGWVAAEERNWSQSRKYLEQALALHQNAADRDYLASIHRSLGELARCEERYELAEIHYQRSRQGYRELGALPSGVAIDLFNLGQTYLMLGRLEEAIDCFHECAVLGRQIDNQRMLADVLEGFANVASVQNQPGRAARLWGTAAKERKSIGAYLHMPDRLAHENFVAQVRDQIDECTFEAAWEEGQAMTVDEAVDYALAGIESAV